MATPTLEERVAALELEVQQLKQRQQSGNLPEERHGWQRFVGVFKDDPLFEEAVRAGREWRESPDPWDDKDAS